MGSIAQRHAAVPSQAEVTMVIQSGAVNSYCLYPIYGSTRNREQEVCDCAAACCVWSGFFWEVDGGGGLQKGQTLISVSETKILLSELHIQSLIFLSTVLLSLSFQSHPSSPPRH